MTVTNVHQDPTALTMSITAEFDASVERCWQLWQDPRQLERWWGPPEYPATFVEHDLTPGGGASYFMTGPAGDKARGWWRVVTVDPPRHLELEDGFADADGHPNAAMPTMTMRVALDERSAGGTRMTITTTFPSAAAMEQVLAMGMEEGMLAAMGQIDALLAG